MPSPEPQFAQLILPLAAPGYFTYRIPGDLQSVIQVGSRVIVPFGKGRKQYSAVVAGISSEDPGIELKDILECLDTEPIIGKHSLEFWSWMSRYYMCHIGEVMTTALPGLLNLSSETRLALNQGIEELPDDLKDQDRMILAALERDPEQNLSKLSKSLGRSFSMRKLQELISKGMVLGQEEINEKYKELQSEWLSLNEGLKKEVDMDAVILSLSRAPKQLQALMRFIELTGWDGENEDVDALQKRDFLKRAEVTSPVVKSLVDKGILQREFRSESRIDKAASVKSDLLALNDDQLETSRVIREEFKEKDVVLLQGVTSSGKTEIYAHLIREALDRGEQVLYLLPEIALTKQLIHRLQHYFGDDIGLYHSRLNQAERVEVWKKTVDLEQEHFSVILGARSAVFLPFQKLGLIIIDEEHDRSFKQQDPAPRYSARDAAIVLAGLHGAKVLLGSATPSLDSRYNCQEGKYGFVRLDKRFGGFQMPTLQVVNLIEERRKRKMSASFSSVLLSEMREAFDRGEQVILFQNRRGYAPLQVCDHCGHSPTCKNCDITLTHHKNRQALICHLCGFQLKFNPKCTDCAEGSYRDMGTGTERIEEELSELMPDIRSSRFDLDSTRKKHAFHRLIQDFESGQIDVLIGTQMVTKGLDFENVGLVGIINADLLLKHPDFRAHERAFQMLTQVAGRAGRKSKQGKVIIQAYESEHPAIGHVLSRDYENFLNQELEERKLFHYPPYYRMIELRLRHRDRQDLYRAAKTLGEVLQKVFGPALLGPEFPYIARVRNRYSMHFILRFDKSVNVVREKKKLSDILDKFTSMDNFRSINVQFDVDPY